MRKKLQEWLGFIYESKYISDYFKDTNIRGSLYMSLLIIVLELGMIISVSYLLITRKLIRSNQWIFQHMAAYVILIVLASMVLAFSILYRKGKVKSTSAGMMIIYFFSAVCLLFGIFISYLDFIKGEQIITFITMQVLVICLLTWRPVISAIILAVSYILFYILITMETPGTYATKVNLLVMYISILMAGISIYRQRWTEANKDEELEEANHKLAVLASTDALTGDKSMYEFYSRAAAEVASHPDVDYAVLFCDIMNFKIYNERYGYEAGNELLVDISATLNNIFPGELISRFSDDHFVVLTATKNPEGKLVLINTILKEDKKEAGLRLKTGMYRLTDRPADIPIACDHARYACAHIKKNMDTTFCEYTKELADELSRKQHIINNIDDAIENGYIKVYYQPIIDAETGMLSSAEALARWEDKTYGLLSPGVFIPVLEEYRHIHKLDICILDLVCRDIRSNLDAGKKVIPVSINFSRLDVELFDLPEELEKTIERYKISSEYLHVEFTESALVDKQDLVRNTMKKIHDCGYSLWLDDFGSGYSGLNVLKDYNFDLLKLDMRFLEGIENNNKAKTILKNIVNMALEINMDTLAEGVETLEQVKFLKEIGVKKLQGYYYGKPMEKAEFDDKIETRLYTLSA